MDDRLQAIRITEKLGERELSEFFCACLTRCSCDVLRRLTNRDFLFSYVKQMVCPKGGPEEYGT